MNNPPDPLIGAVFDGKYEVLELLGTGGMGAVYKAREVRFARLVAIKVLNPDKVDLSHRKRLQNEAKLLQRLSHPNIVKVYRFAVSADGNPYLVLEYLDGKPLSEIIRNQGSLSLDQFWQIFDQIISGMTHAHQQGLIHRDLKPANVMICEEAVGNTTARIVDFGVAKLNDSGQNQTLTGALVGTPLYMSPEQCAGQRPSPQSDIYSLGCLMYEALSGRPPFTGDSFYEIVTKHMNEELPPIELAGGSHPPAALRAVIAKALVKDPKQRFPEMKNLSVCFAQAKGAPDVVPLELETKVPVKGKGASSRLLLLIVLTVLVGGGTTFWMVNEQRKRDAVQKESAALLVAANSCIRDRSDSQSAYRDIQKAVRLMDMHGVPHAVQSRDFESLARSLVSFGRKGKSADDVRYAAWALEQVFRETEQQDADPLTSYRRAKELSFLWFAVAYKSKLPNWSQDLDSCQKYLEQAWTLAVSERRSRRELEDLGQMYSFLSAFRLATGSAQADERQAIPHFEMALKLAQKSMRILDQSPIEKSSKAYGDALIQLSACQFALKSFQSAEENLLRAKQCRSWRENSQAEFEAVVNTKLADVYIKQEKWTEAEQCLVAVVANFKRHGCSADSKKYAYSQCLEVERHLDHKGRFGSAIAALQRLQPVHSLRVSGSANNGSQEEVDGDGKLLRK